MPISSLLLGLTLALVVLPIVLEPFLRRARRRPASAGAAARPALTKVAALVALRDLDFDYQTGKVIEADYAPLRQQLLVAAADAAQREKPARRRAQAPRRAPVRGRVRMDQIVVGVDEVAGVQPGDDADADIEAAVRSLRQGESVAGRRCPACGCAASPAATFCGHCGSRLGQVCPSCQAAAGSSDRFCARCGASLNTKVVTNS